jgi:hypothetical protein
VIAAVAHATMHPFLLGVAPVTPVLRTRTFEMAFYPLVSTLSAAEMPRAGRRWGAEPGAPAVGTAPLPAGPGSSGPAPPGTGPVRRTGGAVSRASW